MRSGLSLRPSLVPRPDEEGYLFIPDGSGALAYFRPNPPDYSRGFNEAIYGQDKFEFRTTVEQLLTKRSQVVMPVFGWPRPRRMRPTSVW